MDIKVFGHMIEQFDKEFKKPDTSAFPTLRYLYDKPGVVYEVVGAEFPKLFLKREGEERQYQYNMSGRHVMTELQKLMSRHGDKTPVGYKLVTRENPRMPNICKLEVEK